MLYCNLLGVTQEELEKNSVPVSDRPEIDRWIISAFEKTKSLYIDLMDGYQITKAVRVLSDFAIDDLSNWYVRRNRKRFRTPDGEADKMAAYGTLYEVLTGLLKLVSPIAPFLTEKLYRNLTGEESVHLSYIAENSENIDAELNYNMDLAKRIVSLARFMRVKNDLKTRQPLRQIMIAITNDTERDAIETMKEIILEEINIKELNFIEKDSSLIRRSAKLNFKVAGPRYGKDVKKVAQLAVELPQENINQVIAEGKTAYGGYDFTMDDLLIQTENIEGWVIESQDNLTIALDTTLDDALLSEGIAREFVSKVQNIRKERNMDVNDKVKINFVADKELSGIITSRKNFISEQITAVSLDEAGSDKDKINGYEELNINGRNCKVSVEKVG